MKLIEIFCLFLLSQATTAQARNARLDEDPVFIAVLSKRIQYPFNAERSGVYAKVYAGFHIDQKGRVQEVSILNPTKIGYGFEEEVSRKIKILPALNPKYEGDYALPIAFALPDYANSAKIVAPTGKLSEPYIKDRILLRELTIIGGKTSSQRGKLTPFTIGQVLTTDH